MIVLVKMKDGKIKKTFIRNHIFQECDDIGKKIGQLKTEEIKAIYWPNKTGIEEVPTKKWLETAETENFWGLN
jgi:hypothetical protein